MCICSAAGVFVAKTEDQLYIALTCFIGLSICSLAVCLSRWNSRRVNGMVLQHIRNGRARAMGGSILLWMEFRILQSPCDLVTFDSMFSFGVLGSATGPLGIGFHIVPQVNGGHWFWVVVSDLLMFNLYLV